MSETTRSITNEVTIRLNLNEPIPRSAFGIDEMKSLSLLAQQHGLIWSNTGRDNSRGHHPLSWFRKEEQEIIYNGETYEKKSWYDTDMLDDLGIDYELITNVIELKDVEMERYRFENLQNISPTKDYLWNNLVNADVRYHYQSDDDTDVLDCFKIGKLLVPSINVEFDFVGDKWDSDSMVHNILIKYKVHGSKAEDFKNEEDGIRDFNQTLANDIGLCLQGVLDVKVSKLFACNAMVDVHISQSCDMYVGQPIEEEE